MARPRLLSTVVKEGDYVGSLTALRDHLAKLLDDALPNEAASIARQLSLVLDKINALPEAKEASRLDGIADAVTDELAEVRRTRARQRQSGWPADGQPDTEGASGT